MEFEEKQEQELDLFVLLSDLLKEAKRFLILLLVLVVMCSALLAFRTYTGYAPSYTAYASFTVRVVNPLYSGISSYNTTIAEQMAKTFPHILTSGVLQAKVKEELGISYMSPVSVTANPNTSIITIEVRDRDPQRAYDVLSAVITYYPDIAEYVVGPTSLVLLDESGLPTSPTNPLQLASPIKKGVLIGAALWLFFILIAALTKNTVHNEEELSKLLNSPCLGQIPSVKLPRKTSAPLITSRLRHPGFTESIRLLRMRVEKSMAEQNKKVLLISSAIPGEGKTTVSVNLALSMAKKGQKVLLIDCDLRNPSVAKALNLTPSRSIIHYIRGQATVRDVLTPTEVSNLFIIAGGDGASAADSSKLSQERSQRLLQAAQNLFDVVILDTPPCSMLADAAEIAELADFGLMVIRQDFASRDQILDGIQRLGDGNLPILGCVMNNMRRGLANGYGYGYGYGYGSGYGYGYGSKK